MKPSRDPAGTAAAQLVLPLLDRGQRPSLRGADRRFVLFGAQVIEYELRRSRRRSIGFLIDASGLRVTAPRSVAIGEIEDALRSKQKWILRKLVEWREHVRRRDQLAIEWTDGATVPFAGTTLTLSIDPARRGVRRSDDRLIVGTAANADADFVRHAAQEWLKAQARLLFGERLPVYAQRLGIAPRRWQLSSARTRWGSCSADGSIRLNWRLIHFPLDVIDYVIAHEIAHLKEMNHSPRFWATLGAILPEYEAPRLRLKEYPDDLHVR